jgi:uncharacterized protein (DUF362 family)
MRRNASSRLSRRDFLRTTTATVAGLAAGPALGFAGVKRQAAGGGGTAVVLIKTSDRKRGAAEALRLLEVPSLVGKKALVKPNFNTADPTPGSTHNDTLSAIITGLRDRGAASVTVGERSGPPQTKKVMEDKGIFDMAEELGFGIVNFEDLSDEDWLPVNPPGNHWDGGFFVPRPVVEADYVVSTCCLKTHAYGGVFSMSLKLAVGLTPKRLMRQLHRSPDQRRMIAEINQGYAPRVIILDGVEAFVDGGPSEGKRATADVFIAGTDRVAVDAAGLAVLKDLGSNEAIMNTKVFDQEQIRRAVDVGLGVTGPGQIRFVTPDAASRDYARKLQAILARG